MSSFAGDCENPGHPGDITQKEADAGILPSHGISLNIPGELVDGRPPLVQYLSTPAYQSPLRHHRRSASAHRQVKETLDARSEYMNNEEDGRAEHHINQYIIKDEIGRGSFGAVHLAVDQYGTEFAVKEFSKSRLRKRAQSNILRRPHYVRRPGHLAAGSGFNSPLHRHSASDIHINEQRGNPLYLIKEEIAIMKKLNHPNLVSLIEVLDDPEEDSLYMVLEMCKKGVVMKVGLGEKADPYDVESCRCWFRDLILGIEYLHAQGVVHRDIKPDNLLLTEDDVLKVVDFGVSEMFEKASDMMTAKSTGSPAFLPPELCVTKHGDVSGRAADIWSMGISLYCLRFGHIPFERTGVLELYEAIKNDEVDYEPSTDPQFVDLMRRILEKDPKKRITMDEIREHPWVTNNGTDPLLPKEENIANLVEPPSEIEVNHAITAKMRGLLAVMKAVKKFKSKMEQRRPNAISETLGKGIRVLHPSIGMTEQKESALHRSKSSDLEDRRLVEAALAAEGVHHDGTYPSADGPRTMASRMDSSSTIVVDEEPIVKKVQSRSIAKTDSSNSIEKRPEFREQQSGDKGHAHDPLDEQPLYLGIGAGVGEDGDPLNEPVQELIAESPTAADFNIYDTAYQQEVDRIRAVQGHAATVYLTRRVDHKKEYKADRHMKNLPNHTEMKGRIQEGWKGLVDRAQESKDERSLHEKLTEGHQAFSELVSKAVENTRNMGRDVSEREGATSEK
ncbi:putative calcium calmodulin-dependent protein kinase kinase protein [Botrytis fragariae]|uniref:Putative calcium calmodulin-dependent protein kinase kinase protein n=1 Tax=Botrytis fragariae TaxID=1964551 RepID=A0A8H6B4F9_9HELO|nr:putative calcium calmodulin-dependent protein kinase kinase protein [Botrytis fragariae]KAF5879248.1 putative calcium calmodulin-dependent protein kinase kinase protein [Botrytis fragariae]